MRIVLDVTGWRCHFLPGSRVRVCKSVWNPWHRETRAHTINLQSNPHRILAIEF